MSNRAPSPTETSSPPLTGEVIPPPVGAARSTPFSSTTVTISKAEYVQLRCDANYWKAQHSQAVEKIGKLQAENAELKARVRDLTHRLFGQKTEKNGGNDGDKDAGKKPCSKRPRGQQAGSNGHGRRDYGHLPAKEEVCDFPPDECHCPKCGKPFEEFPGTEDSETVEIEVSAYRQVRKRKRAKPTCKCGVVPGVVTAPAPPKIIPKGIFGISIWVMILLDKYLFLRSTYRLLMDLATHGLDIAQGTVTDGLQRLAPLFEPIYEALIERNLEGDFWHADETRWFVFSVVEGKVGFRWYMWVFVGKDTVVFRLDPSRSAKVPDAHFGQDAQGILEVDRYISYKAMLLVKNGQIILAFCWAHVRRDFLDIAKGYPEEESWAMEWVEMIGNLYHLNALRLEVLDNPEAFAERDRALQDAVEGMEQKRDAQLKELEAPQKDGRKERPGSCKKVLKSLENHWPGLTIFLDHPEVPMDNNEAERKVRKPAVARKNFYGSGATWSGQLAAFMFSIFQTMELAGLNPRLWLTAYLEACAANGSKAPADIQRFLPWSMSEEQRQGFEMQPAINDSS